VIIDEQVEVLTLAGNIGRKSGKAALHTHNQPYGGFPCCRA
jgi:predicted DNA-binding protein with PD1-like motif